MKPKNSNGQHLRKGHEGMKVPIGHRNSGADGELSKIVRKLQPQSPGSAMPARSTCYRTEVALVMHTRDLSFCIA